MASSSSTPIINHFTHPYPNHNLEPTNTGPDEFLCCGCKTPGTGAAYKCQNPTCTFILHATCASISDEQAFPFFLHPEHPLHLLNDSSLSKFKTGILCDLCKEYVHGMWYRCVPCHFDVHPICAHLPQMFTDRAHPGHEMHLRVGPTSANCNRCGSPCNECHYRCNECKFVSHLECLIDVSGPVFCYRVAHRVISREPISPPAAAGDGGGQAKDKSSEGERAHRVISREPISPPAVAGDGGGQAKDKSSEGERKKNKNIDHSLHMIGSSLNFLGNIASIASSN